MKTTKWYQERTFQFTMKAIAVLGASFTIGTWLVDGEVKDFSAAYLFGSFLIIVPVLTYLMRNNK